MILIPFPDIDIHEARMMKSHTTHAHKEKSTSFAESHIMSCCCKNNKDGGTVIIICSPAST